MRGGLRPIPTLVAALLATAGLVAGFAGAVVDSAAESRHINLVTIKGSINPASADYVIRGLEQSEKEGAEALLIELDTPGGLVSATRDIIQAMLNSPVPGASCSSATMTWHGAVLWVAAMHSNVSAPSAVCGQAAWPCRG